MFFFGHLSKLASILKAMPEADRPRHSLESCSRVAQLGPGEALLRSGAARLWLHVAASHQAEEAWEPASVGCVGAKPSKCRGFTCHFAALERFATCPIVLEVARAQCFLFDAHLFFVMVSFV